MKISVFLLSTFAYYKNKQRDSQSLTITKERRIFVLRVNENSDLLVFPPLAMSNLSVKIETNLSDGAIFSSPLSFAQANSVCL